MPSALRRCVCHKKINPPCLDDTTCVTSERLKRGIDDLFCGAPDLAIEVVFSDLAERLHTKIRLYLKHGSEAVWVVYAEQRIIQIHSSNGHGVTLEQDQVLEGRNALSGFSTPVSALFEGL